MTTSGWGERYSDALMNTFPASDPVSVEQPARAS